MVVIMIGRKRSSAARRIGVIRRQVFVPLGDDGEIDEHDAVLLHDTDEQDDADQRDQAEIEMEQHQRRERPYAGRRQGREDRDRVDVAFIQDAEDQIDDNQRRRGSAAAQSPAKPGRPGRCPGSCC